MPDISVIMPIYNAEKYIYEALISVCKQSYQNIEIIVIDDGSTDRTLQIVKSIKDSRIVIISRANKGLVFSLNEGVQKSKGRFIARMDADDVCHNLRFEKQIRFLRKNKSIGALFTSLKYVDCAGKVIRTKVYDETRVIEPNELLFGCPVCHPTAMFNTEVIPKSCINYDPDFINTEDFELWTRLINKFDIAVLSDVLFRYRVHGESITSRNNEEQRKLAVKAILKNLIGKNRYKYAWSLGIVYNNRQYNDTFLKSLLAFIVVLVNLKKMNQRFSKYAFAARSYHLLKAKFFEKEKKSFR